MVSRALCYRNVRTERGVEGGYVHIGLAYLHFVDIEWRFGAKSDKVFSYFIPPSVSLGHESASATVPGESFSFGVKKNTPRTRAGEHVSLTVYHYLVTGEEETRFRIRNIRTSSNPET